jgi:hypothetical protein
MLGKEELPAAVVGSLVKVAVGAKITVLVNGLVQVIVAIL